MAEGRGSSAFLIPENTSLTPGDTPGEPGSYLTQGASKAEIQGGLTSQVKTPESAHRQRPEGETHLNAAVKQECWGAPFIQIKVCIFKVCTVLLRHTDTVT